MTIEQDLDYLETMAGELKAYLLGEQLYWAASGTDIRGTLGGIMLRRRRLYGLPLEEGQQGRLSAVNTLIENEIDQWMVQAEQKAAREMSTRIDEWGHYIQELEDDPNRYASDFRNHAEGRTIIRIVSHNIEAALDETHAKLLADLDTRYRMVATEAPFLWDEALTDTFPQSDYWWLYSRPSEERDD